MFRHGKIFKGAFLLIKIPPQDDSANLVMLKMAKWPLLHKS
jgi:hypothetical protein